MNAIDHYSPALPTPPSLPFNGSYQFRPISTCQIPDFPDSYPGNTESYPVPEDTSSQLFDVYFVFDQGRDNVRDKPYASNLFFSAIVLSHISIILLQWTLLIYVM